MEELAKYLLLIFFAATVSEAVIEFLVTPILDAVMPKEIPKNLKLRTVVFNWLSAIFGVVIAVGFHLETFRLLGGAGRYAYIDQVLTGILLGRGANFVHTLIQTFLLKQEEKRVAIAETIAQADYYTKHTPE